jgi:uncharacterized membrane protein (DUF4010 family)
MVVLIVGLSLTGYIIYKLVSRTASVVLGGILGGMISSTATTVSYARRAKDTTGAHGVAVAVILISSAVSYLRVIIEVSLIAPSHLGALLPPLSTALVWASALAAMAFLFMRGQHEAMPPPSNPAQLKSAVVFGIIYAAVTLAVATVKAHFGSSGLYGVAFLSGLTDMDAITLSVSRTVESGQLAPANGWRLILAASLSNFAFKGMAAMVLGGGRFGLRLTPYLVGAIFGGLLLLWLWPQEWVVPLE